MSDLYTENDDLKKEDEPVTQYTYELKHPFEYAHKGNVYSASFVELKAPSTSTPSRAALKQCFYRALPKTSNESATDKEDKPITGSEIVTLIAMSEKVKLDSFIEHGRILLSSGVALVEGSEKLTKPLIDKMHPDELEDMIGAYMVNFILASAFASQKGS